MHYPNRRAIANKILEVVKENPQGLWLTAIGKIVGIHRTSVIRLINEYLLDVVDVQQVKPIGLKLVRLKEIIQTKNNLNKFS